MKIKMLAAMTVSGFLAASIAHATPPMDDNVGSLQGPTQLADNNGMSGSSTMSGLSNNMSGTSNNNMSGTSSPSDEGGADTATGDDY